MLQMVHTYSVLRESVYWFKRPMMYWEHGSNSEKGIYGFDSASKCGIFIHPRGQTGIVIAMFVGWLFRVSRN